MTILDEADIDKSFVMIDKLIEYVGEIAINDLDGLDTHTRKLIAAYSLSTDVMAGAEYWYRKAVRKAYSGYEGKYTKDGRLIPTMSVSIIKQIAESQCETEAARLTKASRVNAALTHSIDAIRSLISKGKAEMEMIRNNR